MATTLSLDITGTGYKVLNVFCFQEQAMHEYADYEESKPRTL